MRKGGESEREREREQGEGEGEGEGEICQTRRRETAAPSPLFDPQIIRRTPAEVSQPGCTYFEYIEHLFSLQSYDRHLL